MAATCTAYDLATGSFYSAIAPQCCERIVGPTTATGHVALEALRELTLLSRVRSAFQDRRASGLWVRVPPHVDLTDALSPPAPSDLPGRAWGPAIQLEYVDGDLEAHDFIIARASAQGRHLAELVKELDAGQVASCATAPLPPRHQWRLLHVRPVDELARDGVDKLEDLLDRSRAAPCAGAAPLAAGDRRDAGSK